MSLFFFCYRVPKRQMEVHLSQVVAARFSMSQSNRRRWRHRGPIVGTGSHGWKAEGPRTPQSRRPEQRVALSESETQWRCCCCGSESKNRQTDPDVQGREKAGLPAQRESPLSSTVSLQAPGTLLSPHW